MTNDDMSVTQPLRMDSVIEHSFKDYHVKGFDYLCLRRSETLTVKLYFFEGNVAHLPEVVNPHDHRYDFMTFCLSGKVTNRCFLPSPDDLPGGKRFNRFHYRTPLLGGSGFEWDGEETLYETTPMLCEPGKHYLMTAEEYHTIRIHSSDTVIMLHQYADVVPVDAPTKTFTLTREPPALSGLYNKFNADQVRRRLNQLRDHAGIEIATE